VAHRAEPRHTFTTPIETPIPLVLSYGVLNSPVVLDGLEANPAAEELLSMFYTVEGAKQRARELIDQKDWR